MSENKNEFNVNDATPTEKMPGDMNTLKDIGNFTEIGDEERQKVEEQIANITNSLLSALKENVEILKSLSDQGFGKATEAISMLNSIAKETTGVGLDTIGQTASGMDRMARGIENENLTQTFDGAVQTGIGAGQIYAGMNGMGPEVNAVGEMVKEGHLKETLKKLSNYGQEPAPELDNRVGVPAILAEKGKENTELKDKPKLSAWQEFDNALLDVEKGVMVGTLKSCGWLAKKGIQISGAISTGVLSGVEAIDRWQKGNSAVHKWEKETTRQMELENQRPGFKTVVLWTPHPLAMEEVRKKGMAKGINLSKLKELVKSNSVQGQGFVNRTTNWAVSKTEALFNGMKDRKGR